MTFLPQLDEFSDPGYPRIRWSVTSNPISWLRSCDLQTSAPASDIMIEGILRQ